MSCDVNGCFSGPNFSSIPDHIIWTATNNCNGYVISKPIETINFTVCASLNEGIEFH